MLPPVHQEWQGQWVMAVRDATGQGAADGDAVEQSKRRSCGEDAAELLKGHHH